MKKFLLLICLLTFTSKLFAQDIGIQVINGNNADSGEWPFMALIVGRDEPAKNFFCAGTVISPTRVLTAAHCAEAAKYYFNGEVDVLLGVTHLLNDTGHRVRATLVSVNPAYYDNPESYNNDVGTIDLESDVSGLAGVEIVPLATEADAAMFPAGTTATVLGWGYTHNQAPIVPPILQEAQMPIIDDNQCLDANGIVFEPDGMLCAGVLSSSSTVLDGVDTCNGDSGGPLLVPDGLGGFVQVGITSWGWGCATDYSYGVYAEVPTFLEWIQAEHPAPPINTALPEVSGKPVVGEELSCSFGTWESSEEPDFFIEWEDEFGYIGSSPTIVIPDYSTGLSIRCIVYASNPAGESYAYSDWTDVVQAAGPTEEPTPVGPSIDSVSPQSSLHSVLRKKRSFEVLMNATDDQGIKELVAILVKTKNIGCSNGIGDCVQTSTKQLKAFGPDLDGHWLFTVHGRARRSKLLVTAIDKNGNAQEQATIVKLRRKRVN